MPKRGEGTKAWIVHGGAAERRVELRAEGGIYLVPAGVLRHHPNHADCPALLDVLRAPNSWKELVTKGAELRARTARCTGGCWDAYERRERERAARGDQNALRDWEEDGVSGRARIARLYGTPLQSS